MVEVRSNPSRHSRGQAIALIAATLPGVATAGRVDPNLPTRDSWTPLPLKYLAGQKALVLSLLEHGTTVDVRDATGESPRVEASCRGRQAIVETLLSKRAAANLRGTVQEMVEIGSNPSRCSRGQIIALVAATLPGATTALRSRHREMAIGLLAGSVDSNLPTRDGRTPLLLAALTGNKALVLGLLGHGTTIDARDATGESPCVEASYRSRQAIVETLLSNGAAADLRGTVPLY
ncbi:unnamed protein product [Ectocarpus sp. CCAP 1310/34]|nr:unnamed protein product [Ectocarpus sp. CCAP 1310/34]